MLAGKSLEFQAKYTIANNMCATLFAIATTVWSFISENGECADWTSCAVIGGILHFGFG